MKTLIFEAEDPPSPRLWRGKHRGSGSRSVRLVRQVRRVRL